MVTTQGARVIMIDAIPVDQFTQYFRFHVVLQLAIDFKAFVKESHHSLHLSHVVLIVVILAVRGRLNTSSHVSGELVLGMVN